MAINKGSVKYKLSGNYVTNVGTQNYCYNPPVFHRSRIWGIIRDLWVIQKTTSTDIDLYLGIIRTIARETHQSGSNY